MSNLIATIFHITDMHLFVDASGRLREDPPLTSARLLTAAAKRVPVPQLGAFLSGAMWHDEDALAALLEDLPEKVSREREGAPDGTPILVLQTGDVEALGSAADTQLHGYSAFPSFEFVHQQLRAATGATLWSDIYGNHDTWPGTYPAMRWRHRAINRERIATVPGLQGPWPETVHAGTGPSGVPVFIARVNTVSRTLLEETLAAGTVSDHPPGGAPLDAVIDDLTTQLASCQGPAVRIVMLHHPPHPFETTLGEELTTGWLEGGGELARRLSELRVQLVIAGHRHKLDPAYDIAQIAAGEQPPLCAPTVQLVAESPTQDSVRPTTDETDYHGLEGLSYCRYRLFAEGDTFDIERTVFQYVDGDGEFSRETSANVFKGIALE